MEIMNEKDRKKMIVDSHKFGGISLRRQMLRVHKNGAKFPISKAYIDDELLDPDVSYTLILIPEAKLATKTTVTLTFFKRRSGPHVFYSFPENVLNNLEKESIAEIMIQASKERFFINQSSIISSANYYFELHSDWARGNKEMLMISVSLDRKINQAIEEIIHSLCTDFESQLSATQDNFKALYINDLDSFSEEEQADVRRFYEDLKGNLKEFYKKIEIVLHQRISKHEITVSLEIEKKLDLSQIAQKIENAEFNPEKFPGLIIKNQNPSATIILFSKGKMMISGLKRNSEAKQIVDKIINELREIGINLTNPKISIESIK
ncbi:MAG: hypothetical protein HWN79_15670 [Candidatus Lokiarchaeota archaeon]|nr:hypothetical protein [Candidatus Lokiarchaeota archaeon]